MDMHKALARMNLTKNFLTGLVTVLPIVITVYLLFWAGELAEAFLGQMIRVVLPDHLYVPGMGLLAGVVITFLTGLLMHAWIVRRMFGWSERLLYHIPVIRSVYGATRDFLQFLVHSQDPSFSEVVTVDIGNMRLFGFVTRPDARALPDGAAASQGDTVIVYLPMSYQIGGFTVVLPRSAVHPVDMSMREAMTFVLTAGVANPQAEGGGGLRISGGAG
jgi:uncharacterized membrane protein